MDILWLVDIVICVYTMLTKDGQSCLLTKLYTEVNLTPDLACDLDHLGDNTLVIDVTIEYSSLV